MPKYEIKSSKLSKKSIERIKGDVQFNFNTSTITTTEIRKFEKEYFNKHHGYPAYSKLSSYIMRNL